MSQREQDQYAEERPDTDTERRWYVRRQNPADDPGPPVDAGDRRLDERRLKRRRKPAGS